MKKIKGIKNGKTQKGNDVETKRNGNSAKEESSIWPEAYEEQRSMNLRMKEQPFPSSAKPEKKKNQK